MCVGKDITKKVVNCPIVLSRYIKSNRELWTEVILVLDAAVDSAAMQCCRWTMVQEMLACVCVCTCCNMRACCCCSSNCMCWGLRIWCWRICCICWGVMAWVIIPNDTGTYAQTCLSLINVWLIVEKKRQQASAQLQWNGCDRLHRLKHPLQHSICTPHNVKPVRTTCFRKTRLKSFPFKKTNELLKRDHARCSCRFYCLDIRGIVSKSSRLQQSKSTKPQVNKYTNNLKNNKAYSPPHNTLQFEKSLFELLISWIICL